MDKHEKNIQHTFGVAKSGQGYDHLHSNVSGPNGSKGGNPVNQPHRMVKSKHEEIGGAVGMKSHGCIDKLGQTVGGGKGRSANIKSDTKVQFRPST